MCDHQCERVEVRELRENHGVNSTHEELRAEAVLKITSTAHALG